MAWLTDWAKRIKLTVNSDVIDTDLTNFPIAITLASGTGVTNADVTDVFSELTASGTTDTYTKLLLHMNDTNLIDSSIYEHTTTIVNDVYRSAVQSKFGSYSAYFEGNTDDTLTLAESNDWNFGTDDWTIDFWIWRDGSQVDHAGVYSTLVTGLLDAYGIGFGDGATANKIRIRGGASGSYTNDIVSTDVIPNQTWTHIAFVRYLDMLYLYIDGVYDNSINCAGYNYVHEIGYGAVLGKLAIGYSGYYFKGYIDELRVSKGIAKWTTTSGNFSVPTQPYTNPIIIDPAENRKKIALTTSDGTTQRYVEIENWAAQEAVLWTSLPTVYSGTDTDFYLYYDSTKADNTLYVGDTGESAAQNVWDSNFVGVFHMAQSPTGTVKNSTSVGINASSTGSMTADDLVDGKVGLAIDFDGTGDYLKTPSANDVFNITDTLTVECIFKPAYTLDASLTKYLGLCGRQQVPSTGADSWAIMINDDGKLHLGTTGGNIQSTTASWSNTEWHYVAGTYNSSGLTGDLFRNNLKETLSVDSYDTMAGATNSVTIGVQNPTGSQYMEGIIDEVRVSNIVRPDAWVKATYYSNFNNLITYSAEQTMPIFTFDGYVSVEGSPAERTVHLFRRSTGELMDTTISNPSTGYFELGSHYNDYHFIVILPLLTETYNLLSYDKINPGA